MPLYEYQCGRCGRFEVIRKFSDAALTVCPTCGQDVQKLPSAPAIQFKGTGWYITDYARKSSGAEGAGAKDGKAKAASGAEGGGSADAAKGATGSSPSPSSASETSSTAAKTAKTAKDSG
ncbi:MAG TPA: FmdB family zinc ribbon protein [Vicinamibacteria bacterium]|nr:FmdB family zinc ribbon protein [Vicinamibacteria bacterium]